MPRSRLPEDAVRVVIHKLDLLPTFPGYWPLLYNVSRDPAEAYNVASHNPEQVERLATQLASWKKSFYADVRDIQDAGTQRRRQ